MRIHAWRVPPYDNGMYLVVDDRREALLIDPAMGERQAIAAVRPGGDRYETRPEPLDENRPARGRPARSS